jgi:hypothetical protein
MIKRACFSLLFLLFLFFLVNQQVALSQSDTMTVLKNVEIVHLADVSKQERGACYSGKLVWDGDKWRRQIVIYNNSPEPSADHPVYNYVKRIPSPTYKGVQKWESFQFKEFLCQP